MKEYEIWSEGYVATGEHQGATFHGRSFGENFIEACKNFQEPKDIMSYNNKEIIIHKGDKLNLDKNTDGTTKVYNGHPSIWGCRLLDNEADARRSFG